MGYCHATVPISYNCIEVWEVMAQVRAMHGGSQVGVGVIKCFVLRMVVGLKTMRGLESDRLFLDGMHLIF